MSVSVAITAPTGGRFVVARKLKVNGTITRDQELAHIVSPDGSTTRVKASIAGTLTWLTHNEAVLPGDIVIQILPCSHAEQYEGLCTACGEDVSGLTSLDASSQMIGAGARKLQQSQQAHQSLTMHVRETLLNAKKLALVVDIDHTILHACRDPALDDWFNGVRTMHPEDDTIHRFELDHGQHYVKLRPGLRQFLDTVIPLYDVYLYTMGVRSYALQVRHILDPERKFLKRDDHIISRDDAPANLHAFVQSVCAELHLLDHVDRCMETLRQRGLTQIVDLHHVPDWGAQLDPRIQDRMRKRFGANDVNFKALERLAVDHSMVLIVDDRHDVWARSPENVLRVFPFHFFVPRTPDAEVYQRAPSAVPASRPSASTAPAAAPSLRQKVAGRSFAPSTDNLKNANGKAEAKVDGARDHSVTRSASPSAAAASYDAMQSASGDGHVMNVEPALPNGMPNASATTSSITDKSVHNEPAVTDVMAVAAESQSGSVAIGRSVLKRTQRSDGDRSGHTKRVCFNPEVKETILPADDTPDPAAMEVDDSLKDNVLDSLALVLSTVHRIFYENDAASSRERDVRTILTTIKRGVFKDIRLVFSGVFPQNIKAELSDEWKLAEEFGAACERKVVSEVTHVIAARTTEKTNRAKQLKSQVKVVHVSWFWNAIFHFARPPEDLFGIDDASKGHELEPMPAYDIFHKFPEKIRHRPVSVTIDDLMSRYVPPPSLSPPVPDPMDASMGLVAGGGAASNSHLVPDMTNQTASSGQVVSRQDDAVAAMMQDELDDLF